MRRLFTFALAMLALALAAATLSMTGSSASGVPSSGGAYRSLGAFKPTGAHVRVDPRHYSAVSINAGLVRAQLSTASKVGSARSTVFRVPTPTGGTERFAVQRTEIMQKRLAAAHPEIETWAGTSLDHPGTSVALDVTPMGFHASVRGPDGQGAWYVDPAYNGRGTTQYLSYYGSSLPKDSSSPVEREIPQMKRAIDHQQAQLKAARASRASGKSASKSGSKATVTQRVYRLALLNDPTYAAYFGSQNVLAEKVTLMNRVNQIYNDDAAIKMVLVNGTPKLNLDTDAMAVGPNGPCGAHPCYTYDPTSSDYVEGQLSYCDVGTLERNQIVLGQLIGAANYDIGHIALGTDGGGIAGLGVVGSVEKAMGCTGIPTPAGDAYAIDYVAHEMGHEFGGDHTFNGNDGSCGFGNRARNHSVEPGSGSSIMAYAGICGHDDLQPHSDPYFSQHTIAQFTRYNTGQALDPVEVQDVSLTGFSQDGDTITLSYPGSTAAPVTLTRGSTYTAANIATAIKSLTGEKVTIGKWGYDPYAGIYSDPQVYPAPLGSPDDAGFQVMFAADADPYTTHSPRKAMHSLIVTTSAGVTAHVGETARGGPPNNGGSSHRTGNHAPVVKAPANRTIPLRTPFTLRGSGKDADGDALTYLWEQNDIGGKNGTHLVSNKKVDGPLFRVFGQYADVSTADDAQSPAPGENHAGTSPARTFPDLSQILAGDTNAKTGRCPKAPANPNVAVPIPVVNCFSEFLPTKGYLGSARQQGHAMHFRLTARDNVPGGGGVGHADVTLKLDQHAGPFLVSSFEKGGKVHGGAKKTITWKVNGTRSLASHVRIVLSTDNGKTWKKVLVSRTANDGRATVRFPKKKAAHAWIMIKALDNYFFDVNDRSFRIS